jgi:hypothetical protein
MAQKTKIKKDFLGLYVIAGGYISRPFYGTIFKEDDIVKTHHFGGSTGAGVTFLDKNFKRDGKYELWSTTGITGVEYRSRKIKYGYEKLFGVNYKTFEEYLEANTNWYKGNINPFANDNNKKFTKEFKENVKKQFWVKLIDENGERICNLPECNMFKIGQTIELTIPLHKLEKQKFKIKGFSDIIYSQKIEEGVIWEEFYIEVYLKRIKSKGMALWNPVKQ